MGVRVMDLGTDDGVITEESAQHIQRFANDAGDGEAIKTRGQLRGQEVRHLCLNPGNQSRNESPKLSFSTAVRTAGNGCTVHRFHLSR